MRQEIILWVSIFMLTLVGCFEDEGNYTYAPVEAPVFTFNDPEYLTCYGGDTTFLKGSFYFERDSAERLKNVRYEWILNDVVLSTERDFNVPTDTVIKKLNLETGYTDDNGLWGTFNVIEKSTGIRYMYAILFDIRPKFWKGQWLILSENGDRSKLTYLQLKKKSGKGKIDSIYSVIPGVYEQNNGAPIPGKPVRLIDHVAKNISVSVGATLILTDQVAYEINNEDFVKALDLKEQFMDGYPGNNPIVDAYYANNVTFVATADGQLYKRAFTANWLGGKFISDPYSVDSKGYKVTAFGKGLSANNSNMFPCYDELNRRVLISNQWDTPFATFFPVTPRGTNHPLPVWELPEGIEYLYLAMVKDISTGSRQGAFCLLFNQDGKTYMSDFLLDTKAPYYYAECFESNYASLKPFPGKPLDKESRILISANTRQDLIFYTVGNELRYVNRTNERDDRVMTFSGKITMLGMSSYNYNYNELAIGLENGDFMLVNVENISKPYIIKKSVINVGGKVVSASQVGCGYHIE